MSVSYIFIIHIVVNKYHLGFQISDVIKLNTLYNVLQWADNINSNNSYTFRKSRCYCLKLYLYLYLLY